MSDNVRFTTWLSPRERAAIDGCANELNTSANVIVRLAIRAYLGLDKNPQMLRMLHVTSETADNEGD